MRSRAHRCTSRHPSSIRTRPSTILNGSLSSTLSLLEYEGVCEERSIVWGGVCTSTLVLVNAILQVLACTALSFILIRVCMPLTDFFALDLNFLAGMHGAEGSRALLRGHARTPQNSVCSGCAPARRSCPSTRLVPTVTLRRALMCAERITRVWVLICVWSTTCPAPPILTVRVPPCAFAESAFRAPTCVPTCSAPTQHSACKLRHAAEVCVSPQFRAATARRVMTETTGLRAMSVTGRARVPALICAQACSAPLSRVPMSAACTGSAVLPHFTHKVHSATTAVRPRSTIRATLLVCA